MGAYITQADLGRRMSEAELVNMTDDAGGGLVDTNVVDEVIADAEAEVNGYLQENYTLPLTMVPALVQRLSIDISVHLLYVRRGFTDEARKQAYTDATRLLAKIAKGEISLGVNTPPAETGATVDLAGPGRIFGRDKMTGF